LLLQEELVRRYSSIPCEISSGLIFEGLACPEPTFGIPVSICDQHC
jgi:hypothetical protein